MYRKTSFISLLCALPLCLSAQTANLSFKGIPITGTCLSFAQQLEAKGFVTKGTQKDGSIRMTGSFAGHKDIPTVIGPVSETNSNVMTITLAVPAATGTWNELTEMFTYYKGFYISKYGEPSELSEKGTGEDYRSLADLKKGTCHYRALWSTGSGSISMTFRFISSTPNLFITYTDGKGKEMAEKEVMDDI